MALITEATTASDSFLMKKMDQGAGITSKILQAIKSGRHLSPEDIEEQILQIRRTRISPLYERVLQSFEDGDLVLIYSNVRVVQAIPFIVANVGGKNRGYVFLNGYGTFGREKGDLEARFSIPMKDLYALMEGAYVSLQYYKNPAVFTKSLALMRCTMSMYCAMFLRILNKEFALSLSPLEYNQTCYCIARFYLENMWGVQNSQLSHSYAFSAILNPNRMDYVELEDAWDQADIKTMEELLTFLKERFSRLKGLSIRFFVEYYMNSYKAPAILGLDVLPYFLFAVATALLGSFIINQPSIMEIARQTKSTNYFYAELSRIV